MSQKAHSVSHPEGQQPAGHAEPSFASLPEPVVAQIAQLSKQPRWERGHPLLRVSRSCRDAVLSSLTAVKLFTSPVSSPASKAFSPGLCARLLHRACCQARPGLKLRLHLEKNCDSLPHLLQPGVECGGWRSVHKLEVFNAVLSAPVVIRAFPALTQLRLNQVELGDGALFSMLVAQAGCPLRSLTLESCNMQDTAVEEAAAALARLPSLKACQVSGYGSATLRIASQLTALTHLGARLEATARFRDTQLVKTVARNTGLQSLFLYSSLFVPLGAGMLQCLLNSCTRLTQLDIFQYMLDDQGLDVLLQHGTSITDLTLGDLNLTRSRADSTCRWQRLELVQADCVIDGLAYLPLRSVQELPSTYDSETLHLRLMYWEHLELLPQAASNLAACPAWKKQPATRILLYTPHQYVRAMPDIEAAPLLSALSPLAGPQMQHLGICINAEFGRQEVQVLARSLGSGLRSLSLRRGVIKPSFWPALCEHLPHLKQLGLMHKVEVNSMGITAYLRTQTQPFTLYIGKGVLADHSTADLTDSIGEWQMQGVSVKQEYPADKFDFRNMDGQEAEWEQEQQEAGSEGDYDDDEEEEEEDGEGEVEDDDGLPEDDDGEEEEEQEEEEIEELFDSE